MRARRCRRHDAAEHEMRIAAILFIHQGAGYGQPFPGKPTAQHWRPSAGPPSRPHRGQ
jgi:hypothetical protein